MKNRGYGMQAGRNTLLSHRTHSKRPTRVKPGPSFTQKLFSKMAKAHVAAASKQ
jgi:hypothetical protein